MLPERCMNSDGEETKWYELSDDEWTGVFTECVSGNTWMEEAAPDCQYDSEGIPYGYYGTALTPEAYCSEHPDRCTDPITLCSL